MKKPQKKRSLSSLNTIPLEAQEKQLQFYGHRLSHDKITAVLDDLFDLLVPHSETNIINIIGPTGVGKSTLTGILLGKLGYVYAPELESDKSAIPLVYVEAYADGSPTQSFGPLYQDILKKLCEPFLDRKDNIEVVGGYVRKGKCRERISDLRRLVENGFRERRTKILVIDEAYHLLRIGNDALAMEALKSLANTAGVKIILVGSYDLFDLASSGSQVARRSAILHFERYRMDKPADRESYKSIIKSLMEKWPCDLKPNFAAISDVLLESTLGCIGLLKAALLEASAMQLRNKGVWDHSFIPKMVKANKLMRVIRKEIEVGEAKINDALYGDCPWDETALKRLIDRMEGDTCAVA
jgi:hypothetical protein